MSENEKPSSGKATKKTAAKKTTAKKPSVKTTKAKAAAEAKAATAAAVASMSSTPEQPVNSTDKKEKKAPAKRKAPAKKMNAVTTAPSESKNEQPAQAPMPSVKPQGVTRISTPPRVKQEQKQAQASQDNKERNSGKDNNREHRNSHSSRNNDNDSPFSQPETVGGDQSNKRNKRRRNRNRKGEPQGSSGSSNNEIRVDHDELVKKAWKIFLGEVNEDGLALMDDSSTREVAKRSFRVAEIFLQEETRRNRNQQQFSPQAPESRNDEIIVPIMEEPTRDQEDSQDDLDDEIRPPLEDDDLLP